MKKINILFWFCKSKVNAGGKAPVTIERVNVNEKLLGGGLAWHYNTYDQNPAWAKLEDQARRDKKGFAFTLIQFHPGIGGKVFADCV